MTFPGPTTNRRQLPYHSEIEMLELEARGGLHAAMLPSNARSQLDALDGITGGVHSVEQDMRGYTAQQPFHHVDCPVMHRCILCGKGVDPDFLRDHKCKVLAELIAA